MATNTYLRACSPESTEEDCITQQLDDRTALKLVAKDTSQGDESVSGRYEDVEDLGL